LQAPDIFSFGTLKTTQIPFGNLVSKTALQFCELCVLVRRNPPDFERETTFLFPKKKRGSRKGDVITD